MFGGAGSDELAAGDGDDYLSDAHGTDELAAGAGNDEMWAQDCAPFLPPRTSSLSPKPPGGCQIGQPDNLDGGGGLIDECTFDSNDLVNKCDPPGTV